MRFYTKAALDSQPPANAEYPCVVLSFDRWNDHGVRTQFDLHYWPAMGLVRSCGPVKILHISGNSTQLDDSFTELDDNYCSLGQTINYYRKLDDLGRETKTVILTSLRDIVQRKQLAQPFTVLPEFSSSLLRFSEPAKLYEEGLAAFDFSAAITSLAAFSFSCRLPGADSDHSVTFNFRDREPLPGRIIAVIGTNGTGKTRYLDRFANAVVIGPRNTEQFLPARPRFSRVIAISYSAFDEFHEPPTGAAATVCRCGIHDANGVLKDLAALATEIKTNLDATYQRTRMDALAKALREILPEEVVHALTRPVHHTSGELFPDITNLHLSSGQLVLVSILSSLAVQIEPDSLVLFDEPEMHLHPNAIGGLMRAIHTALSEFHSYAVMATHSPLILQQLPGRYVRVFRRIDTTPIIDPLPVESFAENLTAITEEIFHASEGPTLYGEWFREILQTRTLEEIGQLFDGRLSFNAKTLVRSIDSQRRASP
jgi:AAA domain, putative AbiEii toxin, Type IV TA system